MARGRIIHPDQLGTPLYTQRELRERLEDARRYPEWRSFMPLYEAAVRLRAASGRLTFDELDTIGRQLERGAAEFETCYATRVRVREYRDGCQAIEELRALLARRIRCDGHAPPPAPPPVTRRRAG